MERVVSSSISESVAIGTIVTPDYLPYALSLIQSLDANAQFKFKSFVFVAGEVDDSHSEIKFADFKYLHTDVEIIALDAVKTVAAENIRDKYFDNDKDAYRWSMKPLLLQYLLEKDQFDQVLILDCDLFFTAEWSFICEELKNQKLLLIPHWRCATDPKADFENFQKNFLDGIFNAGFVGATRDALEILEFWANCCLANCTKDKHNGFFVDQRYLDILHSRFEGVGVLRHKGCNLGEWNKVDCARSLDAHGNLRIDGQYPVVFIHFTWETMRDILIGKDPLLLPHLEQFRDTLKKFHPQNFDVIQWTLDRHNGVLEKKKKPFFVRIKDVLRLRTRFRAFFKG